MAINRYDVATPARDNYFNTFVPLPLDQLTALGMSRKQDLEKNQALLEKAYDDALDIKYIKESPMEEANYRALTKGVTDLAMKYRGVDLSNPIEVSNMRRELRKVADPTLIKRMEESYASHQQAKALKMDLIAKNQWNDMLNEDPASKHNSATGVYNWLPEAYMGREKLLDPYVKDMQPTIKRIDPTTGMIVMGIDDSDVARVANPERAQSLLSTPAGLQEVRLFKKQYPNIVERDDLSDLDIMNRILKDYAEQKKRLIPGGFLPEHAMERMGYGKPKAAPPRRLENLDASSIENFGSLSQVKSKINELNEAGSKEEAKDLQIALDHATKKYGLDKFNISLEGEMASNPRALARTGVHGTMSLGSMTEKDQEILKQALSDISSTTARKYAFGFTSNQLANAKDPNTGKAMGLSDFETLSSNFLSNPLDYEIMDIDDKGVMSDRKKREYTSFMNTKNLENVDIDLLPNEQKEYKPLVKLGYAREKDGKTTHHTATIAINDPTQAVMLADNLMLRGNNQGAAAVMNPQAAQAIKTDNFDQPVTYSIITQDGNSTPITIVRNSDDNRKFDVTFTRRDPRTGQVEEFTNVIDSRIELTSEIYNILGQNPYSRFAKTK